MRAFAALYAALDASTRTQAKVDALSAWLRGAAPADAAWGVYFLTGQRPRRLVPVSVLKTLAADLAGIPTWLFDESYESVGDLAETIALLLPGEGAQADLPLHRVVEDHLLPLAGMDDAARTEALREMWACLPVEQRLVWNKLVTGAFRVGVSRLLVLRALALVSGVSAGTLAHRMMGGWKPGEASWQRLLSADETDADHTRPYPFFLAHPLEQAPAELGARADWQVEWKWDGIRAQLVRRQGNVQLWSRGDELISEAFPELIQAGQGELVEDAVVDGELLVWRNDAPAPFADLQKRLGRKRPERRIQANLPVVLLVYDLLELAGEDLRSLPLAMRREKLEALLQARENGPHTTSRRLLLAPLLTAPTWEALARARSESRKHGVEGLMIKRRDSAYGVGRTRGDWWKWKIEPYTLDAVLVYAQRGHGRRASLYTDYTFAVWDGDELVPFAKAYSGLSDAEIREVDAFIRAHTVEKFGPVRTVEPQLVFEIAFEGLQLSKRHKSGVAVRFPRMLRIRRDKPIQEADRLEQIHAMLRILAADTVTDGCETLPS